MARKTKEPTAPDIPPAPILYAKDLVAPSARTAVPVELQGTPEGEVYAALAEYQGENGLLELVVMVSHDDRIVGNTIFTPLTDRVAGLVTRGFLEVPIVEGGW